MPRVIARNRIPRVSIASRGIGSAVDASSPNAGALVAYFDKFSRGRSGNPIGYPGTYTVGPFGFDTRVTLFMVGAGGGTLNTGACGGGGAGATMASFIMRLGQSFQVVVPPSQAGNLVGGDCTTVLPDGRVLIAGGGGIPPSGSIGGPGGVGVGGDLNRTGGVGGVKNIDPGTGAGLGGGQPGQNGGVGGFGSTTAGGGGGAAGFKDIYPDAPSGDGCGYVGQTSTALNGGGKGGGTSNGSGDGAFLAIVTRI